MVLQDAKRKRKLANESITDPFDKSRECKKEKGKRKKRKRKRQKQRKNWEREKERGKKKKTNFENLHIRVAVIRASGWEPADLSITNWYFADKPVCKSEQKSSYGGAKGLTSEVECHVESKPGATAFRWAFNGTGDMIDIVSSFRTTADGSISVLRYTPRTELDFGSLLCWATNPLGLQSEPCVFHFYAAGALMTSHFHLWNVKCPKLIAISSIIIFEHDRSCHTSKDPTNI